MNVTISTPLGATVTGLDLRGVDEPAIVSLRELLAERGVVILPDQFVDDAEFLRFLNCFGPLAFTAGETPVDGFADLNVVSNVGRSTPPVSNFHVDTSYVRNPPAYTALRAVEIPEQGGETLFTNQYRAFELLPAAVKQELTGRSIRHVVTGLELGDNDECAAEHPVFAVHPWSGRTSLYLSTPARCEAISGMGDKAAVEMVTYLYALSTAPENTLRHRWSPGDVVIWDNRCVLHRADHSGVSGHRIMHRGMVAGTL